MTPKEVVAPRLRSLDLSLFSPGPTTADPFLLVAVSKNQSSLFGGGRLREHRNEAREVAGGLSSLN